MKQVAHAEAGHAPRGRSKAADYFELTKPRIAGMVLVTTLAGYYIATDGPMDLHRLWVTLAGTGLVGAGASALNHAVEAEHDLKMERTRDRPVPSGRVHLYEAAAFGTVLAVAGIGMLAVLVNALSAALAALTLFAYVVIYTPMKRVSEVNTIIGAVPGALPPMIGWAAAAGAVPPNSWTLFAILFFWQIPHFLAIAWLYREDYSKGGFKMIERDDPGGERLGLRVFGQTVALIVASISPTLWGIAENAYSIVAIVLGLVFLAAGLRMARSRSKASARMVLLVSVVYLPLVFAALAYWKATP